MKKKIGIFNIITLIVLVGFISTKLYKPNSELNKKNELALIDVEEFIQTEEFKESYTQSLIDNFGPDYEQIVKKNNESAELAQKVQELIGTEETTLPDYYGGMYINDNNNLVIKIVNKKINQKIKSDEVFKKIKNMENKIIEYVDNSYNDLNKINNKIIEYFESENNNYDNLAMFYIDPELNKVVVELENNTLKEQEKFKKEILDSDLICFKEGKKVKTAAYNPGQLVNPGNKCTIGFRAKLNGEKGFVTAGHCPRMAIGQSYGSYGTLAKRQFSGNIDAAFVKTSTTVTNTLQYSTYPVTTLSTNEYANYINGQIVGTVGGNSGKGQTGKIINTNVNATTKDTYYGQVVLSSQIQVGISVIGGDSGGPLFTTTTQPGTIIGILSGEGSEFSTYTKYSNIKNAWGITRY